MIFFTYLRLIWHIVYALLLAFIFFPWLSQSKKNHLIQYWCRKLLKILDVHLKVHQTIKLPQQGFLIVSNHISWLDIHVINSFMPSRFVAKSEVASWPIFGWLADQLNTLYIKRGSNGEAKKMVGIVSQSLVNGDRICVFPEGTSSDGQDVLEFKSNLFQAGIDAKVPCLPLALDYLDHETGIRTFSTAFIGDMGLIESIVQIVKAPKISVNLYLGDQSIQTQDRKLLAKESRQRIQAMRGGIE
jgi:1-acyl-sn-glycerol-3-phosphate acyltransferase